MDITNRDSYYNSIYQAYIINDDTNADPMNKQRYQIFIPEIHYTLENVCEQYAKLSSAEKITSDYFNLFPWAISLVTDLKAGTVVYGSFIKNQNNQFIILGINANDPTGFGGADNIYGIGSEAILDLAMPIIIENEVGLPRSKWPDGITDAQYGLILPNDNDRWAMGLIQWNGVRAYDVLFQIAKADVNWLNNWPNKSLDIITDLQSSLRDGSSSPKRNNWHHTVYNPDILIGAKNMLTSSIGKTTQVSFAKQETKVLLDKLIAEPYNIGNPAILIFCMDIMNQYGEGVNGVITGCLTKASEISKNGKDIMTQLKEYKDYWTGRTSAYSTRRTNTYNYLVALEKDGRLSALTFVDLTALEGLKHVPEYGEYFWPVPDQDQINCMYGDYTASKKAARGESTAYATYNGFKYNWAGLDHGTFHWGIDIAPKTCGVDGDKLIAVGDGEVVWVNGGGVVRGLSGAGPGQGNCIAIKMNKNRSHNFVYMHLCKAPTLKVGDKVKAGDVVGFMGTTGNSTGTHLHLGLHIDEGDNIWKAASVSARPDPLPYLGKKAKR